MSEDLATLLQHLSRSWSHFLVQLQTKVGRRAFEDGVSQKEIALMLAAGSPTVKQMMQEQRKSQATKYVNRVARLSCLERPKEAKREMRNRRQQKQLEL